MDISTIHNDDSSSVTDDDDLFEDDLFGTTGDENFCYMVETNDMRIGTVSLCPYDPVPNPRTWRRLSKSIGDNWSMKSFAICNDGVHEDEDEIATAENLDAFSRGISRNRSLQYLMMEEYDFSRARLDILHPFFEENNYLRDVQLHSCSISPENIYQLADSFGRRRNPTSIRALGFTGDGRIGPGIRDDAVPAILAVCNHCPRLKKLNLGYSNITNQGCTYLATMLQNPESTLKCLDLHGNKNLGDEGAQILADSLVNNRRLKRLMLGRCGLTTRGWNAFAGIIGDKSSLTSTHQSNHTLNKLWEYESNAPKGLPDLVFSLEANKEKNEWNAVRKKMFHFHMNGNFDMSPFLSMEPVLMPKVLGWIGGRDAANTANQCRVSAIYHILRNIPDICNFPSREKKRVQELEEENVSVKNQVAQLKEEITALKCDNIDLQNRNEQLMREVQELKSVKRQKLV